MIHYTIRFDLKPDKENEFKLSWNSFYENTKESEGLKTCNIKEIGDSHHQIEMIWIEQYYLNLFMKGEWCNFIHGAINVLGERSVITQRDVESA